jgi:hypothetical protein
MGMGISNFEFFFLEDADSQSWLKIIVIDTAEMVSAVLLTTNPRRNELIFSNRNHILVYVDRVTMMGPAETCIQNC